MNFYTKKWKDYIYSNFKEFINCSDADCLDVLDKNYTGEYTDELLEKEFEKYYNAKVKYVSLCDYFNEEFGNYEKIQLLSKEEEFKNYQERFKNYLKELKEIQDNAYANNITYFTQENKNTDLRLLALNKTKGQELESWFYRSLSNKVNGFLSGRKDIIKNKFSSLFLETSFHDAIIYNYKITSDDIILTLKEDNIDNNLYIITLKNARSNISEDQINKSIYSVDYEWFSDLNYHITFNLSFLEYKVIDFWSDSIEIERIEA